MADLSSAGAIAYHAQAHFEAGGNVVLPKHTRATNTHCGKLRFTNATIRQSVSFFRQVFSIATNASSFFAGRPQRARRDDARLPAKGYRNEPDNKTPPLGAAGLDKTSCLAADEESIARIPVATQAEIVAMQRDYIAEALRIAALKAAHAADDIEIGDDAVAERGITLAIQNLREVASAFRQLRRMVSP